MLDSRDLADSKATYLATHGRPGPVWIEIPLDVQTSQIDEQNMVGFEPDTTELGASADLRQAVINVTDMIKRSERPVLLIGNGVRSAGARGCGAGERGEAAGDIRNAF